MQCQEVMASVIRVDMDNGVDFASSALAGAGIGEVDGIALAVEGTGR
jgi:hypothetical protein